jgi:hypothetical protein
VREPLDQGAELSFQLGVLFGQGVLLDQFSHSLFQSLWPYAPPSRNDQSVKRSIVGSPLCFSLDFHFSPHWFL